jgi:hypothetical protein
VPISESNAIAGAAKEHAVAVPMSGSSSELQRGEDANTHSLSSAAPKVLKRSGQTCQLRLQQVRMASRGCTGQQPRDHEDAWRPVGKSPSADGACKYALIGGDQVAQESGGVVAKELVILRSRIFAADLFGTGSPAKSLVGRRFPVRQDGCMTRRN